MARLQIMQCLWQAAYSCCGNMASYLSYKERYAKFFSMATTANLFSVNTKKKKRFLDIHKVRLWVVCKRYPPDPLVFWGSLEIFVF